MKKFFLTMTIACMVSAVFAQEGNSVYDKWVDGKQKYGIADSNGNALTAAKYDWIANQYQDGLILAYISELRSVDNSNNPFAAVKTGHYWAHMHGYLDMKGKEVIPFKYWGAKGFSDGFGLVTNDGTKWAMIDRRGRELTPFKYAEIRNNYYDGGKPVRVYMIEEGLKKRYGVISTGGRELTAAMYDKIGTFYDGVALMNQNNLMGALSLDGREITPAKYTNVEEDGFAGGMCRVQSNNKWGFIDKTGREVVPVIYDRVFVFDKDGSAIVRIGTTSGRVDKTGRVAVPLKYGTVEPLSDGMYKVLLEKKYGWVDQSGKPAIEPMYDYASSFVNGYAYARLNGKYGIINKNNETKVPFQYEELGRLASDKPLFYFGRQGKKGFFSETLTEMAPPKYSQLYTLKEGYAFVQVGNKWGLVDEKGRETVEAKYDTLVRQDDAVLAVKDRKIGVIANDGSVIVPVKYDRLYGFSEGLCVVLLNNKMGYVNGEGKEVIPPQFDEVTDFENGRAQVRLGSQTYFIDKTGRKIN
ncbi:WG repeat-containing protein [Sediminibacterium soli]|uniref:WG repeat-containing protein n=1 Tax=Sediminibacterium soli TaxID=2698829 RepID=UPI00137B7693|nr:WG repeat-containing protein [Sediminibacterium soli]NCI45052.1 WG repeat-containing protein [Sediminibacterium soli]